MCSFVANGGTQAHTTAGARSMCGVSTCLRLQVQALQNVQVDADDSNGQSERCLSLPFLIKRIGAAGSSVTTARTQSHTRIMSVMCTVLYFSLLV